MKIVDIISGTQGTAFSFEILPPLKGTGMGSLLNTVRRLREYDPKYINITTHRSEYVYTETISPSYRTCYALVLRARI